MQKRPDRKAAAIRRAPAAPAKGTPRDPIAEKPERVRPQLSVEEAVEAVLLALTRLAPKRSRDPAPADENRANQAPAVPIAKLETLARRHGKNHELAIALWEVGSPEARIVAALVDDPARVTTEQMERWCLQFDSWAVCDTACFELFDRTPRALELVAAWSRSDGELQKRAAFALLAGVALHAESATDAPLSRCLSLIEAAASDDRTLVKKAVGWALKAIGGRSLGLNAAAVAVAQRLADSTDAAAQWIGRDALRALTGEAATRRIAARARPSDSDATR